MRASCCWENTGVLPPSQGNSKKQEYVIKKTKNIKCPKGNIYLFSSLTALIMVARENVLEIQKKCTGTLYKHDGVHANTYPETVQNRLCI